ncbi:cytochrome c [Magnetospirillum sp. SS-4]|uniref:c-type cytochrome n=1 Tax=Magnetospirillum sp. SS-4 TaxID=2681465 RepID=UPI0013841093|nr:cytochrome c [Magnetospirillum sp. SS-4]CAA7613908.1 putative cytochrome c [Magnetospirillum sp. SS-4]
MTLALVVAVTVTIGGWLAWRGQGSAVPVDDPVRVAAGRTLYASHCAACHGADLEGEQPDWQIRKPSGELPAPPHDASGHTWHHPDEQLFAITKHGMARFAPPGYKTAMPSFVGILTDAEIRSVLAFIQASWPAEIRERRATMFKK